MSSSFPAIALARPDAPAASLPAIEAAGLSRRYGPRWALVGASFELRRAHALLVAGHNGSGKSTLLRLLATAIRPTQGTARVAGHDVVASPLSVRRHVAMLTHHSYLYEALTAVENLRLAARLLNKPSERADLLVHLDRVALADRADEPVHTFSAGMRKRLSVARVLLQEAPVVLLDEPYGQLDPSGFRLIDRLIEDLQIRGATLVLATHLLDRVRPLCDAALRLDSGRVTWMGPAAMLPEPAMPGEEV
jgi:heme exporter protein A